MKLSIGASILCWNLAEAEAVPTIPSLKYRGNFYMLRSWFLWKFDFASSKLRQVRNLGKPVELAGQYYIDGADEVS